MPAIRNHNHKGLSDGANGLKSPNGYGNGINCQDSRLLNKKLNMLLDDDQPPSTSKSESIQHKQAPTTVDDVTNNNYLEEDSFADTQFVASARHSDDHASIGIFSNQSLAPSTAIRDQFADALLRLQTDLDSTSRRLADLEQQVQSVTRMNDQVQRQQKQQASDRPTGKKSSLFSGKNASRLLFLSWPILVYVAMRAIERRSLTAGVAKLTS